MRMPSNPMPPHDPGVGRDDVEALRLLLMSAVWRRPSAGAAPALSSIEFTRAGDRHCPRARDSAQTRPAPARDLPVRCRSRHPARRARPRHVDRPPRSHAPCARSDAGWRRWSVAQRQRCGRWQPDAGQHHRARRHRLAQKAHRAGRPARHTHAARRTVRKQPSAVGAVRTPQRRTVTRAHTGARNPARYDRLSGLPCIQAYRPSCDYSGARSGAPRRSSANLAGRRRTRRSVLGVRCRTSRSRMRNSMPPRLLRLGLHRHEAHRRPGGRLADRLRVSRVVLLAFHEGLDGRSAEPASHHDRASQSRGPSSARSHRPPSPRRIAAATQAEHLAPAQLLAEGNRPVRPGAMKLQSGPDRHPRPRTAGGHARPPRR